MVELDRSLRHWVHGRHTYQCIEVKKEAEIEFGPTVSLEIQA